MKIVYTDVLVIGGGLAGLRMAIGAKRRGHDAIILSLVPPKRSHSAAAQGGMQACLGNVIKGQGDNEDVHFEDTVRGSDWGADQHVVRMFVNTAPKAVRELAAWGVPWSRVHAGRPPGRHQRPEGHDHRARRGARPGRAARLRRHQEVAHLLRLRRHRPRDAVRDQRPAIAESIPVHERTEALALIHDGGRCYGAIVRDLDHRRAHRLRRQGDRHRDRRRGTALPRDDQRRDLRRHRHARSRSRPASRRSATWKRCSSIRPASFPAGILVTEGCRGDGGLLKDADGHRFMPDYEPEKKELASRDVVSRRMEEHITQGQGREVALRRAPLARHHAARRAPHQAQPARGQGDLPLLPRHRSDQGDGSPVRPAQHYTMGGVRTDHTGESPTLKGLFAAGEAACWDMHGFNRLGGNSVAETVVAGMIVGEFIADFCDEPDNDVDIPTGLVREFARSASRPSSTHSARGRGTRGRRCVKARDAGDHDRARSASSAAATSSQQAVDELQQLLVRSRNIGLRYKARRRQSRAGDRLPRAEDAQARAVRRLRRARAHRKPRRALPRGLPAPQRRPVAEAHARDVEDESDTLPTLAYEPLDVKTMELPPGLARLRRQGLHRPPRHGRTHGRGRSAQAGARWRGSLYRAGDVDALRAPDAEDPARQE